MQKISSVENVTLHWNKHGQEFPEYRTSLEYMEGANSFMHNSHNRTLVKHRPNGDILKYDPKTNTFGVMDKNGNPRTMFKPQEGLEYWNKQ